MQDPFDVLESMKGKLVRVALTDEAIRLGMDAYGKERILEGVLINGDDCSNVMLKMNSGAVKLVRGSWIEYVAAM